MKNNGNLVTEISQIKDPKFLVTLSYDELEKLANKIREEIIASISINGGHLSSSLGATDLIISLHRNFDFLKDKILFDVGHQAYAHKILTGRSIRNIRHKGGVSGFLKTSESIYDVFEAGHSSTSLSAALSFAIDRDNRGEKYDVIAFIGDASIANGVALEALNNIAQSNHKVIIVLNDNNMAISTSVGSLSNVFRKIQISNNYYKIKEKFKRISGLIKPIYKFLASLKRFLKRHLINLNIFDTLGYAYIGLVDGHDFKALDKAFKKAKSVNRSVVIHVRTKKGKGYPYAENDKIGYWHGVDPFDITSGESKNKNQNISWSDLYSDFLREKLENDPKFYIISAATFIGSSLENLRARFKDRVIDTGISEEHAIILASYLSKLNYHVAVSIYSTFMQRAYDEIIHDVARINAPITFLVDRAGLIGEDGATHQGIYDPSFLMGVPNVNIAMARDNDIAKKIFNESFLKKEATFIRLPRERITKLVPYTNSQLPSFEILKQGNSDLLIVSVGPLTNELLDLLNEKDVTVIDPIHLKPISKIMLDYVKKYKKILIYTPYETYEGFGSALIRELTLSSFKGDVLLKAIPSAFIEHATIKEQLEQFNLLPTQIKSFLFDK